MKRTLALLLSLTMLMSLLIVPANAADEDVVLKITPDKTSINTATAQDVTYTISVEVKDSSVKIGGIQFTLDAPSGMTIPTKLNADNFQINSSELKLVKDEYDNVTGGIFDTFGYTKETYTFIAVGTTEDRNLNKNAEIMKIKVSVAENTTGSLNFTAKNVEFAKVDGGAEKWTYRIDTTAVEASSATSHDLPVAIPAPTTGGTPETAINDTNYTGSITWDPAIAAGGKFAANTEYTANVTLTAKGEYKFASDVKPIVAGADKVENVVVGPGGSTLTFNAKFPETGNKTLQDIDIDISSPLEVTVPTAAPNATATNERTFKVTGVYDDGSTATTVAVNWEITTTPEPKGVSIDKPTGKLTVTNKAEDGTFTIKATSIEGGHTDIETVTIKKDTPVESAIVATAPATTNITVPNGGKKTSENCSYKFYDQYGAEKTGISATWKMKLEPADVTGVTLTPDGAIAVENTATTCTATLYAEGSGLKSNEITFHITRETSKVTSVRVNAPECIMNVPKVTEPGTLNQAYQQFEAAKVLDQYGQEMTGQTVTWNVANDAGNSVTGVSIDNNGLLTVTNEAPAITVYVTATCLGIESNKSKVTINKEPAKATLVEICDQVGEAPETSLIIPTGTGTKDVDYTAKVYDQYGVYMPTEMVHWALDPATVPGVDLDDTSIPGSATLKVDSTATSGTTFKLKATTATLGTTGVKELNITLTNKTPAEVTTAPKAVAGLEYDGTDQALVSKGTASGGTMQYSLGSSPWSTEIPTAKDAGTYSVQYKAAGDSIHTDTAPVTLEVTIAPKTLTKADLAPTGSTSKVYDGTTDSSIPVGVKAGVLFGSDTLAITGTAVYNSANVSEADTITFTPDAITTGNYRLAATQVLTITGAKITPRDLTVTPNAGQSKKFGAEDPTLHSTNSGRVTGQIPDFSGALSRAKGEAVGQYDITLGSLALIDHFSSGFKASNYTLKLSSTPVKFEIKKADAPTLSDISVSQKYTVTTAQSKDIGTADMPANAGTLTYAKGTESKTGSVTIDSWAVDSTTGKVTYKLSNGAVDDTVTLPVVIKSTNYADATVNVVITLTKPSSSGGGGSSHSSRYTITVDSVKHGTITVSPKSAYKGDTVTITVKPDKGYELDTLKVLDKDGDKVKITEKKGKYTFTMPASKVTIKGKFVEEAPEQIFADVPVDAYCYEAVKWAASEGITGGIGNNLFAPGLPCTRGQIVTFLWRAAGSPAPKSMSSFADVAEDAYYAKAVAWAVENGITGGTGNGKFSPDATCTRAQAVTFLYRASGSPAVSGSAAFSDVAADAYYASAVKWAEKNGITGGIGGGLFGSGNNCTRGQIVTFLYRAMK